MNQTSPNEWVIGLYAYQDRPPESCVFERFYFIVIELLMNFGLSLTHIAAEGEGYSGKLVKPSSVAGKRLLKSRFSGITVLALYVTPDESKNPSYDRVFAVSLNWNSPSEVLFCMVANEGITPFMSEKFDAALMKSLSLEQWGYGFAFHDKTDRQPDFHVLSLDNGYLNKVESQSLAKWYASRPLERLQKLRSVYPLNILSAQHLDLVIGTRTLRDYVESLSDTSVQQVATHTIWRVPESRVEAIRSELAAKNALIS